MKPISLLTTLNQGYLPQLQILLTSIRINNPEEAISLYLLHSGIPAGALKKLQRQCEAYGYSFFPICVDDGLFKSAPVTRQYPKEMYYRLLAAQLLPEDLHRALYLDPDILVINPIRPLWETDLEGNLFAAASHTGKTELANSVNQLRLGTEGAYYNSGVLLMDLDAARRKSTPSPCSGMWSSTARSCCCQIRMCLTSFTASISWPWRTCCGTTTHGITAITYCAAAGSMTSPGSWSTRRSYIFAARQSPGSPITSPASASYTGTICR